MDTLLDSGPGRGRAVETRHPGAIECVDGATGATVEVDAAESMDPALRCLPGADGGFVVVRIEWPRTAKANDARSPRRRLLRCSLPRRGPSSA